MKRKEILKQLNAEYAKLYAFKDDHYDDGPLQTLDDIIEDAGLWDDYEILLEAQSGVNVDELNNLSIGTLREILVCMEEAVDEYTPAEDDELDDELDYFAGRG